MKNLILITLTVFITACASNAKQDDSLAIVESEQLPIIPALNDSFFGEKIDIISAEEITLLTPEQRGQFVKYFHSRLARNTTPTKRVFKFLEKRLTDFDYYSSTTNASESLTGNRGNCLSLAILTKSLADLAGVDISYQLVESEPVYQMEGNLVISSQHIRTVLYEENSISFGRLNLFPTRMVIDYFPTYNSRILRTVKEDEFLSMYYSNKAAEAMFGGDNNLAYWHLKKALELKPNDSNAINIMAVIHERVGNPDFAEKLYLYGLEYTKKKKNEEQGQYLDLLNNYHSLLKRQGRMDDAKVIEKRIGKREEINPFSWISLGNIAYNERDYNKAIKYYRKAKKIAPYLHEVYGGIARAQFQLGNQKAANQSLEKALEKSNKFEVKDMYQQKLKLLRQLLTNNTPVLIKSEQ